MWPIRGNDPRRLPARGFFGQKQQLLSMNLMRGAEKELQRFLRMTQAANALRCFSSRFCLSIMDMAVLA